MDTLPLPSKAPDPDAPPEIRRRQREDQPADITGDMVRRAQAGYYGLVQWVDQQIGLVLDCLEQLGVREKTTILYTTDHGEMIGERGLWQKTCFYEESARVPLILQGPGIPAGMRVRDNTSHLDLLPTLCDLGGIDAPANLRGRSLLPYLDGDGDSDRIVVSEFFLDTRPERHGFMAKRGALKWIDYGDGTAELFDLALDPGEQRNLWPSDCAPFAEEIGMLQQALHDLPEPFRVGSSEWRTDAKLIMSDDEPMGYACQIVGMGTGSLPIWA